MPRLEMDLICGETMRKGLAQIDESRKGMDWMCFEVEWIGYDKKRKSSDKIRIEMEMRGLDA